MILDQLRALVPVDWRPALKDLYAPLVARDLSALAKMYGTDKGPNYHGYSDVYPRELPFRGRKLLIFEIGIGGSSRSEYGGASLHMWRSYFLRADIVGIDIYPKKVRGRRIYVEKGDQSDPGFLNSVVEKYGRPDIVVDDGSHVSSHVVASFIELFPRLNDGGVYAIEDLHTSYDPEFGGRRRDERDGSSSIEMLFGLVDGLNEFGSKSQADARLTANIARLVFYPGLAFIHKSRSSGADQK